MERSERTSSGCRNPPITQWQEQCLPVWRTIQPSASSHRRERISAIALLSPGTTDTQLGITFLFLCLIQLSTWRGQHRSRFGLKVQGGRGGFSQRSCSAPGVSGFFFVLHWKRGRAGPCTLRRARIVVPSRE